MIPRLIANLAVLGAQIFGRAFVEAYKQALTKAPASAGAAAQHGATVIKRTGMTLDEATQILAVDPNVQARADILKKYEHLLAVNEKHSPYIQAKVRNAFETLEAHHGSMNGWDSAKPDAASQPEQEKPKDGPHNEK